MHDPESAVKTKIPERQTVPEILYLSEIICKQKLLQKNGIKQYL